MSAASSRAPVLPRPAANPRREECSIEPHLSVAVSRWAALRALLWLHVPLVVVALAHHGGLGAGVVLAAGAAQLALWRANDQAHRELERAGRRVEAAERDAGTARLVAALSEATTPDEVARAVRDEGAPLIGLTSAEIVPRGAEVPEGTVALPLAASGTALGTLVLRLAGPAALGEREHTVLRGLAGQCASALERIRLAQLEHDMAETLQRSLLPDRLPEVPGLVATARYLPGTSGARVGGDWYDCAQLPDGRVALVLGDVVGKGVRAASVMGQLRNAVRAYALQGLDPAEVLRWTERLGLLGEDELATLVLGVLDVEECRVRLANAGHLPPLVLSPERAPRFLDGAGGLPLGVDADAGVPEQLVEIEPGATVLLYSDGLVEDRTRPLDLGLAQLAAAADLAAARWGDDLEGLCDELLDAMIGGQPRGDDLTLLAVRLLPLDAPSAQRAIIVLPSEPRSVDRARRFTRSTLTRWGRAALGEQAELCTSELVGNAIASASADVVVDLTARRDAVRLAVEDSDPTVPVRVAPSDDPPPSGCIVLVDALADRWGVEPTAGGKRVWCELTGRDA